VKRRNPARDTKPELLLRRALWARGARYRLHDASLPGKPDIVFSRQHVAIFCDGDFWHGRDWPRRRALLQRGSNASYWVSKIGYNVLRDKQHTRALGTRGWAVVRLWESEIRKAPEKAAARILRLVRHRERIPYRGAASGSGS